MSAPTVRTQSRLDLHYGFLRNALGFVRLYFREQLPLKDLIGNLKRYRKLWYLHEMEVGEFFLYRLWREDLDEARYTTFIGWRKHIKSLVVLNPVQYRCLTENKYIFYSYCRTLGLPTPEILGIFDPRLPAYNGNEVIRSIDDLKGFLSERNICEFVVKPAEGTRGQSIVVIRFSQEEGAFSRISGEKVDDAFVRQALGGYAYRETLQSTFLIQERLRPHPCTFVLSENVPFSYRVLTILGERNEPEIIEVYAKAAVGTSDTDNWELGGLTIRLDDQGVCYGANDNAEYRFDVMEAHPTNAFVFKGWKAPFYDEVCDLGLKLAVSFHFARCVAWDIIVADKGVYVIEGNNPWSVAQQEVYDRGLWQSSFANEAEKAIRRGAVKSPWW
jgi:hypothetical protein